MSRKELKLKGNNEMLDVMLSAQKQTKDKGGLGFEKGEIYKTPTKRIKERKRSRMN